MILSERADFVRMVDSSIARVFDGKIYQSNFHILNFVVLLYCYCHFMLIINNSFKLQLSKVNSGVVICIMLYVSYIKNLNSL